MVYLLLLLQKGLLPFSLKSHCKLTSYCIQYEKTSNIMLWIGIAYHGDFHQLYTIQSAKIQCEFHYTYLSLKILWPCSSCYKLQILLNYLPLQTEDWPQHLQKQRYAPHQQPTLLVSTLSEVTGSQSQIVLVGHRVLVKMLRIEFCKE